MIATSSAVTPLEHFEHARECGERGQQCDNANSVRMQLQQLVERAKLLATLEQQKNQIELRLNRNELHISGCQEAFQIYNSARQKAGAFESRLVQWWERIVVRACEQLRRQADAAPAESSLFIKIEPWVCIATLTGTPDAATLTQIEALRDIVDDVDTKVEREINDFEASNHSEYLTIEPKKGVLRRQIELCERLRADLRELQLAIQVCRTHLQNGVGLEQRLEASAQRLDRWLEQLKSFERDLNSTVALVDIALRTGDFQPVHDTIGRARGTISLSPTEKTSQPGMAFIPFTRHPTFIWLEDYVEQQRKRRSKQEEHKQYVEWGFSLETLLTADDLNNFEVKWESENQNARSELRKKHADFIKSLRHVLDLGKYPLEYTFERLEKMRADEPDDVCRLQAQLNYTDPETGKSFEGYDSIHPILQKKVNQIQNMREWLAQFSAPAPHISVRRECPGIVNWDVEKPFIEKQRDRCNLKAALAHCRQVREGVRQTGNSGEALFNGLWPLERARAGLEKPQGDLQQPLSAAARALDKERVARIEKLSQQIDECLKMEQDINWRIAERESRWQDVLEQLANLCNARESLWVRFFQQTRLDEALESFRAACKSYAEICPCDPEFLEILDEENRVIPLGYKD